MEWSGATFGVTGTLLIALTPAYAFWGFVSYGISNTFWMLYGHLTKQKGIVWMNIIFMATTVLGLINYS